MKHHRKYHKATRTTTRERRRLDRVDSLVRTSGLPDVVFAGINRDASIAHRQNVVKLFRWIWK